MNHVKYDRRKPTVWAIIAQTVGYFFTLFCLLAYSVPRCDSVAAEISLNAAYYSVFAKKLYMKKRKFPIWRILIIILI